MPTNAQTQGGAFDPESDGSSEGEGGNREIQAITQDEEEVQPREELGEDEEEGGGEEGALVTSNGDSYTVRVDDDSDGNINSITFLRPNRQPVVMTPPDEDSDQRLFWDHFALTRRHASRRRELLTAINKARDVLLGVTGGNARVRSASRSNSARGSIVDPPKAIAWQTRPLPDELKCDIEQTFFLQIDEAVADKHGNPYVPARRPNGSGPALKWRGSMLGGKFPHAIVSVKKQGDGGTVRTEKFMCGVCNNIELNVRLMRFENGRPVHCSEEDLLSKVRSAFRLNQRSTWGLLESKMYLYCYLEFYDADDNDTPVGPYAFSRTPDSNCIFKPPEAPPSYLNNGRACFYEFRMERGKARCDLKFQDAVTTANLAKNYRNRQFQFVVKAINPFLAGLEGMTVRSSPFVIKSVLHNDVSANERYVRGPDNTVIPSPADDVPK